MRLDRFSHTATEAGACPGGRIAPAIGGAGRALADGLWAIGWDRGRGLRMAEATASASLKGKAGRPASESLWPKLTRHMVEDRVHEARLAAIGEEGVGHVDIFGDDDARRG